MHESAPIPDSTPAAPDTTAPAPVPVPDADLRDSDFEPLHPAARWSMAVGAAIGWMIPYTVSATAALVAWDGAGVGSLAKFGLYLLGAAVVLVLVWRYSGARFRAARFALTQDSLRIRRGVFWRSETLVPRSRVQHTDLNRGPIDRHLGMATLKVYTAGTKLASVSLDGLPDARAVDLRDALVSDADDAL